MTPDRTLLPVAEALRRLLDKARPPAATEEVPLADAGGRVLAGDLIARLTQPPFDASAMDGYALRSADAPQPGAELAVIGQAAAGHPFAGSVGPGEAVRIFTGAPVPPGADAVLIQEDAERLDEERIRTGFAVVSGRHIRPCGQDFAEGETLLADGTPLDFAALTLAAAANHPQLCVYRRPRVALIATGDELLQPGALPGPGQIIASNTFGVAALVSDCGAEILDLGIVADDSAAIGAAIARAVEAGVDVLVTLGGASVGDHDLVQKTLVDNGMELDFWRIAMRPGKPLMVGGLGSMQVLGLPGNPISSLVCALLFLEPLLLKLARRKALSREVEAVAARPLPANDHRQDYLRARLWRDDRGRIVAEPFLKQDSSMMKIFARSGGLVIRPPHAPALQAGDPLRLLLLRAPD